MGASPQYEQVLYPTTGTNAAVNPSVKDISLNGANLTLPSTIILPTGAQVANITTGANAITLGANAGNNTGLPTTLAQSGFVKMTATIANNATTIYIPYWV